MKERLERVLEKIKSKVKLLSAFPSSRYRTSCRRFVPSTPSIGYNWLYLPRTTSSSGAPRKENLRRRHHGRQLCDDRSRSSPDFRTVRQTTPHYLTLTVRLV
jgi:hypothetical protein